MTPQEANGRSIETMWALGEELGKLFKDIMGPKFEYAANPAHTCQDRPNLPCEACRE